MTFTPDSPEPAEDDWRLLLDPTTSSGYGLRFKHKQEYTADAVFVRFDANKNLEKPAFEVFNLGTDDLSVNGEPIPLQGTGQILMQDQVRMGGETYIATIKSGAQLPQTLNSSTAHFEIVKRAKRIPLTVCAVDEGGRENQEDYLGFYTQTDNDRLVSGLWLIADGVGGEAYGEVASQFAANYILWHYFNHSTPNGEKPDQILERLMREASAELVRYGEELTAQQKHTEKQIRVATTISAVALYRERWYTAHVGNSPIYLLRNQELRSLSDPNHQSSNKILHFALGKRNGCKVSTFTDEARVDDVMLICSDGLIANQTSTVLVFRDLEGILRNFERSGKDWRSIALELVDMAKKNGSDDNISIIAIKLQGFPSDQPSPSNSRIQIELIEPEAPKASRRQNLFDRFRKKDG